MPRKPRAAPAHPAPATLARFAAPDYRAPSPDDVRAVKALLGVTSAVLAAHVGVDHRAVRRWLAKPPAKTCAPIPYAAWRLLLLAAGLVPSAELDAG